MLNKIEVDPSIKEEWKDIKGYEGLYQVSNKGRVKSTRNNIILKPMISDKGYYQVDLYNKNNRKSCKIHRLVAQSFIPNPNNYPVINHKDENKANNCVSNLEWCTVQYNHDYGTRNERATKHLADFNSILVVQLDSNYKLINVWKSASSVNIQGIEHQHIAECCSGKIRTYKGYHWLYKKDYDLWVKSKGNQEIWQPLKGFDNYLISNFGNIETIDGNTISSYSQQNSYQLLVKLSQNGREHSYKIDELVALTFIPNADTFKGIKHINGRSFDNRVINLKEDIDERNNWHNSSISKGLLGHSVSEDTRSKISKARLGMKFSDDTKRKLAEAHRGLKQSKSTVDKRISKTSKPVVQLSLDDQYIKTWKSAKFAATNLKFDGSAITKCCKGKLKKHKGYHWEYLKDYNNK